MREAQFIAQRADDWKDLEKRLNAVEKHEADQIANAFIRLTDDLAFAQTYYPKSKTTQYLHQLSSKTHRIIYRNRAEDKGRFKRFMQYEVPLAVKASHPQLLAAFLIFALSTAIGVISALYDDTFARMFLGDTYINMTLENIKKGDPMAVYKDKEQMNMFFGITLNNIMVALRAFAFGIFFSIGTGYILFTNGIMLGTFFTFLSKEGVFREAMLTVWIHGTIEISVIVIAGGAGFVLGQSILFPKTYKRLDAFKQGIKQGMKVVIGTVPFFVLAGFLESFVTRYTQMPIALSLFIILGSLSLVIWYYIIYPIQIHKRLLVNYEDTKNSSF
jgi:uncharacterized membrane protein SpoIIM required for sporulation